MRENRHKHTVWMDDDVWDQVESHYQRDNCTTKNEFIEKAIRFYSGYLDTESADAYLPGSWPTCWRANWEPWANGWDTCCSSCRWTKISWGISWLPT